ncbi:uncharacterized protein CDAR_222031 [Caerostris darwini]|uniref:Gustatory receptor n=1 Tax=Caerostris darwini TaxID=1538125 RepID=A0AAV4V2B1_9ARAC|nr:uncharacterized protein CDAR_222031 [Caerostris darwini]
METEDFNALTGDSSLSEENKYGLKWYSKYKCSSFLLCLLYRTGLLVESDKTFGSKIIFRMLLLLVLLANTYRAYSYFAYPSKIISDLFFRINFIQFLSYLLSIAMWYAMRRKRKSLSILLCRLRNSHPFTRSRLQTFLLLFACSMPITFEIMARITMARKVAGSLDNYYFSIVLFSLLSWVQIIMYPMWTNLIVLSYGLLCQTICRQLHLLRAHIEKCPPQEFTILMQSDVVKHELKINLSVQLLQKVFSVPSFFMACSHFCTCITALGTIILLGSSKLPFMILIQISFMFVNACGGLLSCLWMAGGLPREASKLKDAYCRKLQQRRLLVGEEGAACFEKKLLEISSYVLSGCNIISFYRSSILGLAGTILTYAVLLINSH